jgi:two-component system alkaline phosphatase synthesis response regulator PhoP
MSEALPRVYRLLVVEDERNVGTTLVERLQREGFRVDWVKSVLEARSALERDSFDLALLDVGLPDGDGFQVAEVIRKITKHTAIVFLTAYGNPEDRVRGLELGAEDYIVKPFHLKELLLRIQNSLKRVQSLMPVPGESQEFRAGRARVRLSKFEVEVDDGGVHVLTHKELSILKLLYSRKGEVVSREEILNEAWTEGEFPSTRTIDNFILRLRRLIELDPENPAVIRSVRGVGYQLVLQEK